MNKLLQKIIAIPILLVLMCTIAISFCGCTRYPEDYTLEEHIEKISARVKKTYMKHNPELDSFEIYPLYYEEDQIYAFLVEFEPTGFVFMKPNKQNNSFLTHSNMYYSDSNYLRNKWSRYRLGGVDVPPSSFNEFDLIPGYEYNGIIQYFESNGSGEIVYYQKSPYAIANVLEKKLFLRGSIPFAIPCIKDEKGYLNLISMLYYEEDSLNAYNSWNSEYLSIDLFFKC